jgi:protein required for attachment to host cells
MSKVKISQGDWVVVCDGAKALVLENVGDEVFPNLKTREVHDKQNGSAREQASDAPGRSFQSVGKARSAVEQTDRLEQAEHDFLDKLAARLDAAVKAGETKSLIIVAPPRALGVIRNAYSQNLRAALRAEIDKDLVKLPLHKIEEQLTGKYLGRS